MEPRGNSKKNFPAPISPLFTHQLQRGYKTRAQWIGLQTCERGEGGFGVCSTRSALGSYFHMHCLPLLPSLRSPGLQVSTASSPVFPRATTFGCICPHLIFDNVPNPTAALSRDFRSANTNSAPRCHILSSCSQILLHFNSKFPRLFVLEKLLLSFPSCHQR